MIKIESIQYKRLIINEYKCKICLIAVFAILNNMNYFYLFSIITLLGSSSLNGSVQCGCFGCNGDEPLRLDYDEATFENLQKDFKKLDNILGERAKSRDPEHNMEVLEKFMKESESHNFLGMKIKGKLEDAERLFLSLKQLKDPKMCSKSGFEIISLNAKALKSVPFLRRTGEIFSYYANEHHTICSRLYPAMLAERLAKMDQDKLKRLEILVKQSMNYNYQSSGTEAEGLFSLIKNNNVGPSYKQLEKVLVNLIKEISNDKEPDSKPEQPYQGMFKETLKKYLIEPCEHIMENLADDIFDPATALINFHKVNVLENQFYRSWTRYTFCINAYNQISAPKQQNEISSKQRWF